MKLTLRREEFLSGCTIGSLFVDGILECYTLEDTMREIEGVPVAEWKIPKQTAIPHGTYPIHVTMSNRFRRMLPILVGVPDFEGVRIHPGNTSADTEGCILVGETKHGATIGNSRVAFAHLFEIICAAIDDMEPITLTIEDRV